MISRLRALLREALACGHHSDSCDLGWGACDCVWGPARSKIELALGGSGDGGGESRQPVAADGEKSSPDPAGQDNGPRSPSSAPAVGGAFHQPAVPPNSAQRFETVVVTSPAEIEAARTGRAVGGATNVCQACWNEKQEGSGVFGQPHTCEKARTVPGGTNAQRS